MKNSVEEEAGREQGIQGRGKEWESGREGGGARQKRGNVTEW